MRGNQDFEIRKVTKYDSLRDPWKDNLKDRSFGVPGACKTIEQLKYMNLNIPNNTFDNLWDWRLKFGNLLVGEDMKNSIKVDQLKADMIYPANSNEVEKDKSRNKNPENREDESEKDSNNSEENKDSADFQIKELAKMTELTSDEIKKKYGKKLKKKIIGGSLDSSSVHNAQSPSVRTPKFNNISKLVKENQDSKKEETEFHISDEEAKEKFQEEMKEIMDGSKGYKIAKNIFKAYIKRRRDLGLIKEPDYFNDIKKDEDFKSFGKDVIIGQETRKFQQTENKALNSIQEQLDETDSKLNQEIKMELQMVKNEGIDQNSDQVEKRDLKESIIDGKKYLSTEKKASEEGQEPTKKKKKKRKIGGKEVDQTPEEILEEKIMNYYKKYEYKYLKLEAWYPQNIIPPPAFTSIHEVLPHFVSDQKSKSMNDKVNKQAMNRFAMEYSMTKLGKTKKGKKTKGKKKESKHSEKELLNNSSQSQLSSRELGNSSSEFDSEEDGLSSRDYSGNVRKGSISKQLRHEFFENNEKYFIRKPFPLKASRNKQVLLEAFSALKSPFSTTGKINKVSPAPSSLTAPSIFSNQTGSASKREKNLPDIQMDEGIVNDKFNKDLDEVTKDLEEYNQIKDHSDYKMLYMTIKSRDSIHEKIEKFNWSGNQIMGSSSFTLSQTEKSIGSLNSQKLDIWLTGFGGFIDTTKRYCKDFIESNLMNFILMTSVFLNTLLLAIDGLQPESWTDFMDMANLGFTYLFTFECVVKMYGLGISKYKKDMFNIFDFFVVVLSLVEVVMNSVNSESGGGATSAFRSVRIFRIFRVLRVTRLLRSMRFMQVIIEVVKSTMEQFAYIALLMFLFVFIFTLLGTQIFGGKFTFSKSYERVRFNFDSFETAFYTVFVILTMENWNEILVNCLRSEVSPALTMGYLLAWIFIGNYIFLNLFLAILLEGFESSETMQTIIEIEHETRELERVHQELIKEMEEKKNNEERERKEATRKVMVLIEPEKYAEEEQIKNSSACYSIIRNHDNDNPSLSEEIDVRAYLKKGLTTTVVKIDPFKDVTCSKSLFYFSKKSKLRILCARIVSHPK